MALTFQERKKILKKANTLDLTPIKLEHEEVIDSGLITIVIPKFKNKLAVKYVMPNMKSGVINLKLDKFGSGVWENINGKNSVQKIIDKLVQEFGEEIQPAEERVSKFIFQLYEQRLISFNELN